VPSLLIAHAVAGGVALAAGAAALTFRKGELAHRLSGHVFFLFMLPMAISGVYAGFLIPATLSVSAGVLTAYHVATGWMTVRRKEHESGLFEWGAMLFALASAAGCIGFGVLVMQGELTEYAAGAPIPAATYFVYGAIALFSAALDLSVIVRRGLAGAHRIARHLWRMCFAMLTSASAFFLGQPQVFPRFVRESPFLLYVPVLAIIVVMAFWLMRVYFTKWARKPAPAQVSKPA